MDPLLRLIERTDGIMKFFVKCPEGKRGRPMNVGRASEMNKIDPGSVCAKETAGGKTVFYGTGNKQAGKQAHKNISARLKADYASRGMDKTAVTEENKMARKSSREAEADYKERQNTPEAIKDKEIKRAMSILSKYGISLPGQGAKEEKSPRVAKKRVEASKEVVDSAMAVNKQVESLVQAISDDKDYAKISDQEAMDQGKDIFAGASKEVLQEYARKISYKPRESSRVGLQQELYEAFIDYALKKRATRKQIRDEYKARKYD